MFDFGLDLDAENMAELEKEIRETCKITIRTLEIFYEELQKSNLPDSIKTAILVSQANSKYTKIKTKNIYIQRRILLWQRSNRSMDLRLPRAVSRLEVLSLEC